MSKRKSLLFGLVCLVLSVGFLFDFSNNFLQTARADDERPLLGVGEGVERPFLGVGEGVERDFPQTSCPETLREYPQCGGTFGLEDKIVGHTYIVTEFTDNCTGAKRWTSNPQDQGNLGQCGAAPAAPAPIRTCEPVFLYPECSPDEGAGWVREAWQDCNGNYSYRNNHFQGGVCGHTFAPVPVPGTAFPPVAFPTPAPVFVFPTPVPVVFIAPTPAPVPNIFCPAGFTPDLRGSVLFCIPPAAPPQVVFVTPTPIPDRIVAAPTPAVINARVNCPDGFVQTIAGSNILCMQQIQNQQQSTSSFATANTGPINVVVAGNSGGVVERVEVVTDSSVVLPKTGLPLFAWAFSGFAPLGFGLTRFRNSAKMSNNIGHFLWQNREYNKN